MEGGMGWGAHMIFMRGLLKNPGSTESNLPPINVLREGEEEAYRGRSGNVSGDER